MSALFFKDCNSPQDADNCIIRFCFLHLWDIRTNTESVSLFSSDERRKFDRRESKPTTCRVISFIRDRRGAVAYFIFEVSYDLFD